MKAEGGKGKEDPCRASPIKNGRRGRRPRYRRHKAGTAYGCFVSDLTRFAANPCIGPGRPLRRPSELIIYRLDGMGKCTQGEAASCGEVAHATAATTFFAASVRSVAA